MELPSNFKSLPLKDKMVNVLESHPEVLAAMFVTLSKVDRDKNFISIGFEGRSEHFSEMASNISNEDGARGLKNIIAFMIQSVCANEKGEQALIDVVFEFIKSGYLDHITTFVEILLSTLDSLANNLDKTQVN
jgi:hypothetical protein